MASSWYRRGEYKEIVESWSAAELKKVCAKIGLPIVKTGGGVAKMRASIKNAIVNQAEADGAMDTAGSEDSDASEGEEPIKTKARSRRSKARDGASSSAPSSSVLDALAKLPSKPTSKTARGGAGKPKPKRAVALAEGPEDSDSDLSASSGADSSSDDDSPLAALSRGSSRVADGHMESTGLARPMAKGFLRNVLSQAGASGSVYKVYKYDIEFKRDRNHKECVSLARMLDSLLNKKYKELREQMCRRLAGVHAADTSGNWAFCDAFELVMDKQSFVPDDLMQRAVKNVMRMQALENSGKGKNEDKPPRSKGFGSTNRGKNSASQRQPRGGAGTTAATGAPSASHKKTDAGKGGSAD